MNQSPFNMDSFNDVYQPRPRSSFAHAIVRDLIWGAASYLVFKRFGHIKLVRLVYAVPMGYGLALAVALLVMFVLYVVGIPLFGINPTWAEQGLTDALPSVLVFLYLGTRWTRKIYRSLTRQST